MSFEHKIKAIDEVMQQLASIGITRQIFVFEHNGASYDVQLCVGEVFVTVCDLTTGDEWEYEPGKVGSLAKYFLP